MSPPDDRFDEKRWLLKSFKCDKLTARWQKIPREVRWARWCLASDLRARMTGTRGGDLWECDRLRVSWVMFLGWWCGKSFFSYDEIREEASRFAAERGFVEVVQPDPLVEGHAALVEERRRMDAWDKMHLRLPLKAHLIEVVKRRSKAEVQRRAREKRQQSADGRAIQAMRLLASEGRCPACGEPCREEDTCGHGFLGVRLRRDGTVSYESS